MFTSINQGRGSSIYYFIYTNHFCQYTNHHEDGQEIGYRVRSGKCSRIYNLDNGGKAY